MELEVLRKLLESNTERTSNPLGVSERECGKWARDLGIPERGEVLLYTGCLYQMAPQIELFSDLLRRFESIGPSFLDLSMRLYASFLSMGIDISAPIRFMKKKDRYLNILRNIAYALRESGVKFACLREEPYNGVLYHDLGLDELFERQMMRVAEKIREAGAKKVITIDPHSTYMLKYHLAEYIDIEVFHYSEILLKGYEPARKELEATIHDPCYLARWSDSTEQIRELLRKAGVVLREPEFSRKFTGCCGGPIESIFPDLASKIAEKRLEELKSTGASKIIVACPICLLNLKRVSGGLEVLDLAEVIV
jgi:Fe-S oxidoreductase